jgi:CheY-like chemotaxis protein
MKSGGELKNYIILADDDEDDRIIFKETFKELSSSLQIRIAEDGFELLNYLEKPGIELPYLILLDLNMPLINGFECLEAIKKDERLRQIQVIIYSTSARQQDIDHAYALGAQYYISKPETHPQLKEIIKKIFETDWNLAQQKKN